MCNGTDGEKNSFLTPVAELSALCSMRLHHTVHYLIFLSYITNGLKISQAFCKNPPTQLGPLTQWNGSVGADTSQPPRFSRVQNKAHTHRTCWSGPALHSWLCCSQHCWAQVSTGPFNTFGICTNSPGGPRGVGGSLQARHTFTWNDLNQQGAEHPRVELSPTGCAGR